MNRHERRAAASAAKPNSVRFVEGSGEHFSRTTDNGLMRVDVIFGMLRRPDGGEPEVRAAFRDVVASLREFADGIEKINATTPPLAEGGDA